MAVHDEHLFKCRLPILNLQLELTDEKQSKNLLLELDEQELNKLIDQMTEIEQVISFKQNKKKKIFLYLDNEQYQ